MLRTFPLAVKQACLIAAPFLLLALLFWATGLDDILARAVYAPGTPWAVWLRKSGVWAGQGLLILGLVIILIPGLGKRKPALFHVALVTVIAGIFAAGLLNQVILQAMVDRPRPRESVLLDAPAQTELRGQSFPSGHASIGFIVAVPALVLASRQKKRKRLTTFLIGGGIAYGLFMGYARMVLGAHFASDVLFAGTTVLGLAAFAAPLTTKIKGIPFWLVALVIFLGASGMVLGNKFTLDLTLPAETPWQRLALPCGDVVTVPTPGIASPQVAMQLKGYGAPLSNLGLFVDDTGTVRLQNRLGIYHSLRCTAVVKVPQE